VHVLTPPDYHLSTAMPFVQAGKKVLLEKPVGVSTAECDQLRSAAKLSGAFIGVNQNLVFNPAYVQLRNAVMSGSLGRPAHTWSTSASKWSKASNPLLRLRKQLLLP